MVDLLVFIFDGLVILIMLARAPFAHYNGFGADVWWNMCIQHRQHNTQISVLFIFFNTDLFIYSPLRLKSIIYSFTFSTDPWKYHIHKHGTAFTCHLLEPYLLPPHIYLDTCDVTTPINHNTENKQVLLKNGNNYHYMSTPYWQSTGFLALHLFGKFYKKKSF